uniref:VMP25 protein n=1 Tax=Bicyclus anynana TaxID=110368 RepID=A0A1C9EGK9_BICAN|nr:VMP25 protein [Bicyclus anynana]
MYGIIQIVTLSLALSCVRSHVIWEAPNELHPVHGLYVKPSKDGTTGDLYVAATEENGVKTQWLTDQPINFLPAATTLVPKTAPLPAKSSLSKTTQEDKIAPQKRAIITSPALKYAYALPISGLPGENVAPYPYAIPTTPSSEELVPPCSTGIPAAPYPFQYFYPQMLAAIANAMKSYKENDSKEENPVVSAPLPYWPQGYGYPYQYVFVDPNAWAQSQPRAEPLDASNSDSGESA